MWILGDFVCVFFWLFGLWRIVVGYVCMGRSFRMMWEGVIIMRLLWGFVDWMRILGWGLFGRYLVIGFCFFGNKNYELCFGVKCKKECYEVFWIKKYKVNDFYIYIVYNCNNIVEWNSYVIFILILYISKELKYWKKILFEEWIVFYVLLLFGVFCFCYRFFFFFRKL